MSIPPTTADLSLDDRGRFQLPRPVREWVQAQGLAELVAFATDGAEGGIFLCTPARYDEIVGRRLEGADPLDLDARIFAMTVAATACRATVDRAGRVLVPSSLRNLVGLEKDLYLFTAGEHFELWNRERFRQRLAEMMRLRRERALRPAGGGDAP